MTTYPGTLDSFTAKSDGAGHYVFAAYFNDLQAAIMAIQAALGTNPQGGHSDVAAAIAAGGGGGGGGVTSWDSSTTYTAGDAVSTETFANDLYVCQVGNTNVDPETYNSTIPHSLGETAGNSSNNGSGNHTRVSYRFQVSTNTTITALMVQMSATTTDGTDRAALTAVDPATAYTPLSTTYAAGGQGDHLEYIYLDNSPLTLTANTNYWIVLAGDQAAKAEWATKSLSGAVSQSGNLRYSDATTALGTTATASANNIRVIVADDAIVYWKRVGTGDALRIPGYLPWQESLLYPQGALVSRNNGLYLQGYESPRSTDPEVDTSNWRLITWMVPAGGTTGQVLTKSSNADGDYGWQ